MKKARAGLMLLLLFCGFPGMLAAQDVVDRIRGERVAVLPFINQTEEADFDRVARSFTETLELILRWSQQYDVRTMDPFNPFRPEGRTEMATSAAELRIRSVVFGRITESSGGRIALESAVYGTDEGRILGGDRKEAFGAFDIVEASDELLLSTASAMLGYEVELGAIVLTPSRDDVTYLVRIDGVSVGENVRVLPQVLAGRREVEIAVPTAEGDVTLYAADHLIRAGEARDVSFSLPAVTRREQEEIRRRHRIARDMLGEPRDYRWAREALAESGELLDRTRATGLESYREDQTLLEALWELNREFSRISPQAFARTGDRYEPGEPLQVLPVAQRLRESSAAADPRVMERVLRSGYTQYRLMWLRWGHALAEERWREATAILSDLERVDTFYDLNERAHREALPSYREAMYQAELLAQRRRRPWPYMTLGAGIAGVGFGSYMYATDETQNYSGSDRQIMETIQWSSMAAGGLFTLASVARIRANARAEDEYLREWARREYGHLMDTAVRTFDRSPEADGEAQALVLGPAGEVTTIGSRIVRMPELVAGSRGESIPIERAPIVSDEHARLLDEGITILTVR